MNVRTRRELERLMHFNEMATAWLFVASGASLIAVKETWQLERGVRLVEVCLHRHRQSHVRRRIAHTILRVQRRQAVLAHARPDRCDE
jgi:hypothetical protein